MERTTTQLKQVSTVLVPVRDQDRAIEFYVDKLGFEKRSDAPFGEGDRWVEVGLPGAGTTLGLTSERGEWVAGRDTGVIITAEDVDAVHAQLLGAGVDADPQVARMDGGPPPMFWLRDVDGNRLLVIEA